MTALLSQQLPSVALNHGQEFFYFDGHLPIILQLRAVILMDPGNLTQDKSRCLWLTIEK